MVQLLLFPTMEDQSTSSSVERRAKTRASQASALGWSMAVEAGLRSTLPDWLMNWRPIEDFDGLSGKTSQECSVSTRGETSRRFFRLCADGKLEYPTEDGETSESQETHRGGTSACLGECWTCSMSEWTAFPERFHKDEGVSSLSDILVVGNVPPRYYLSSLACAGIIRRAELRGKELPQILKDALKMQMDTENSQLEQEQT